MHVPSLVSTVMRILLEQEGVLQWDVVLLLTFEAFTKGEGMKFSTTGARLMGDLGTQFTMMRIKEKN